MENLEASRRHLNVMVQARSLALVVDWDKKYDLRLDCRRSKFCSCPWPRRCVEAMGGQGCPQVFTEIERLNTFMFQFDVWWSEAAFWLGPEAQNRASQCEYGR